MKRGYEEIGPTGIFGLSSIIPLVARFEDGVLADMHGTIISTYKINESNKLFVDIYDGTISDI